MWVEEKLVVIVVFLISVNVFWVEFEIGYEVCWSFVGWLELVWSMDFVFELFGIVNGICVDEGDWVKKGDVVVVFDMRVFEVEWW